MVYHRRNALAFSLSIPLVGGSALLRDVSVGSSALLRAVSRGGSPRRRRTSLSVPLLKPKGNAVVVEFMHVVDYDYSWSDHKFYLFVLLILPMVRWMNSLQLSKGHRTKEFATIQLLV
ncbi:hypothetical protein F2Q68_00031896 [Brassica cretica]|uniref:Uncharacterized protein n=1 Tax=Brassica cretica TaxID=69181 RepID=A0A8S9GE05_BRACR|nr:hypothetical protein F2Q68_00031896 [Brassica cretica]